jgi:cyanophycin synthetase
VENFSRFLIKKFSEYGNIVALKSSKKSISYQQLIGTIDLYAENLKKSGIKSGDVVALTLEDEFELSIFSLALGLISAVTICLPRSLTLMQRKDCLSKSGAHFYLFCDAISVDNAKSDVLRLMKIVNHKSNLLNHKHSESNLFRLALGSGSTGDRKLIPITHDLMKQRIYIFDGSIPYPPGKKSASCVHIEYGLGYFRLITSLYRGLTHIFLNSFTDDMGRLIEQESINQLSLTTFHLKKLLEEKGRLDFSAESLESLIVGSSIVPEGLRRAVMKTFGDILTITYGTNETLFLSVLNPKTPNIAENSIGFSPQGVEVEIVGTDDSRLDFGDIGKIRVKSPGLIREYLNNHPDNQKFFRDGWFYTGDMGKLTHAGELVFCGRADDMMVLNGINIYPAEIESCLMSFPGVEDAFAFSLKHPESQDSLIAFVVSKRGDEIFFSSLMAYAAERLGFRAPLQIKIVNKLPRSEAGKIAREAINQMVNDLLNKS